MLCVKMQVNETPNSTCAGADIFPDCTDWLVQARGLFYCPFSFYVPTT